MSKLEDALKRLTPEQRALLERKIQEKRQVSSRTGTFIGRRANAAVFPLSPGQQRLLFQERLIPGTSMFNIIETMDLRGPLNVGALEQAIGAIVDRHSVLRSRFAWEKYKPFQWIEPAGAYSLPYLDLSDAPEHEAYEEALDLARLDYAQPFDLEHTPLLRCRLIKVAARRHVLTVTMHHAVSDGWSFNLFFNELSAAYAAVKAGEAIDLPALAIDYADFALWHAEWLLEEDAARQRAWWVDYLAGAPEPLQLPSDRQAAPTVSFAAASRNRIVPPALSDALRALSVREEVTPFVLFLTALKVALFRFTGQQDLMVCAPLSGRRREELEAVIGYFNNILPIRTRIDPADSFGAIAGRVARSVVDINDRQEIPFQQLVEIPSVRRVPLTRAFFTFQDGLSRGFSLPGIEARVVDTPTDSANFDFTLYVELSGNDVVLQADYRTELFSAAAIDRVLDNLMQVLSFMTKNFQRAVGALPAFDAPPALDGEGPTEEEAGDGVTGRASTRVAHVELVPGSLTQPLPGGDSIPRHIDARRPLDRKPAPVNEMEIVLTQIWEKALGINPIGPNENFFELGGHSLLAVSIFDEIQQRYPDASLPLAVMLQSPTIASLAARLRGEGETGWSPLVVIQAGRSTAPIFCIHGAGGNVLFYRDLAIHMGPDQAVFGLQSQGLDGEMPLLPSVEAMAARYLQEIVRVQPNGPYYLVGYCLGGTIALEIAQQLRARGQEADIVAMLETYNWIKAAPDTLVSRLRYTYEKFEFHLRNFLQLSGHERQLFLDEKKAELKRRRRVWMGALFGWMRPGKKSRKAGAVDNAVLARVWDANDRAAEAYRPSAPTRVASCTSGRARNTASTGPVRWCGMRSRGK
ncbi:MAG: condensation domain-containing protein [Rhodothermales bacterium]|nr:condensation domain-containing protein [Rhodothermales bacterium]